MIGQKLLNKIDCNLQFAKDNKLPYGGINIMFSGDFYQHSAVKQLQLYTKTYLERQLKLKSNF